MINFSLPNISDIENLSSQKDTRKVKSYLTQLTEQLRYILNNIDTDNLSGDLRKQYEGTVGIAEAFAKLNTFVEKSSEQNTEKFYYTNELIKQTEDAIKDAEKNAKVLFDSASEDINKLDIELKSTKETAENASSVANEAKSTAENVTGIVQEAQNTANTANQTASNASDIANEAKTKAENVEGVAQEAKSTAESAKTMADEASGTANSAQEKANQLEGQVNAQGEEINSVKGDVTENKTNIENNATHISEITQAITENEQDLIDIYRELTDAVTKVADDVSKDLEGKITASESRLTSSFSESYTLKSETLTLEQEMLSRFTQSARDIMAIFSETYGGDALGDFAKQFSTYIRFSIDGLEIGKTDNIIVAKLANNKLSFVQKGTSEDYEVAYISDKKLYIKEAQILKTFTIGDASQGLLCDMNISPEYGLVISMRRA